MTIPAGYIQFYYPRLATFRDDYINVYPPVLGYKTTILLPFDITENRSGRTYIYDNGTAYDKRICECEFLLPWSQAEPFSYLLRDIELYFGNSCWNFTPTLAMGTGTGFYPFGPDKGNLGTFSIKMYYDKQNYCVKVPGHSDLYSFRIFLYNDGAWPSYAFKTAVTTDGDASFNTVTNVRYPHNYYNNIALKSFVSIQQLEGEVQQMNRLCDNFVFDSTFEMSATTPTCQRILYELVTNIRASQFYYNSVFGYNLFGVHDGLDIAQQNLLAQIIHDKIEVVHVENDLFKFQLGLELY